MGFGNLMNNLGKFAQKYGEKAYNKCKEYGEEVKEIQKEISYYDTDRLKNICQQRMKHPTDKMFNACLMELRDRGWKFRQGRWVRIEREE